MLRMIPILALAVILIPATVYSGDWFEGRIPQAAPEFESHSVDSGSKLFYWHAVSRIRGKIADDEERLRDGEIKNVANLPFLRLHKGGRTEHVALVIHGLSDGPAYIKDVSDTLFAKGYNVVGILLPGHGTDPKDLLTIQRQQWKAHAVDILQSAHQLGEKVTCAGFSTGAAVCRYLLERNHDLRKNIAAGGPPPVNFKQLIEISPLYTLESLPARLMCRANLDAVLGGYHDNSLPEENPDRYTKIAKNAACEARSLANEIDEDKVRAEIVENRIRVHLVSHPDDRTVKPQDSEAFFKSLPAGLRGMGPFYGPRNPSPNPELEPNALRQHSHLPLTLGKDSDRGRELAKHIL